MDQELQIELLDNGLWDDDPMINEEYTEQDGIDCITDEGVHYDNL